MFFIFIVGTHFFNWGSQQTSQPMRCSKCGTVTNFIMKKGMRFITLFFIVPVIPISGIKELVQCPNCKTRFQMTP
jgi:DNA-directed RNA polymerase subunit RPC12/RpoP